MHPLEALFAPRRLAVLGASRNPAKLGHVLLRNVLSGGFPGEVHVVNASGEWVLGHPSVRDASDLPEGMDLALVSLPPSAVLSAIAALGRRGTRMAVILTSGFGEVDERGRTEQAALLEVAKSSGLRLVGPNCMGVYSGPARLNGTYFWDMPATPGGIAVVSQSGAYGGLIIRHLGGLGLGVCRFLSIGNQMDLEVADALEYLAGDAETSLVACFLESVRDGRRFVEAASRVTRAKPMVVLKGGATDAGRRAAGSHTGSLAGTAEVYEAAFRRGGIVPCRETEEFFDAIQALASTQPRPERPALAVVTVSGGPSVVAADAAEAAGIAVPPTEPEERAELARLLPTFAALGNPVDMTPQVDAQTIGPAAAVVLGRSSVGGALAVNVGLDMPEFADALIGAARLYGKPLLACAVDAPAVMARFRASGVPVYPTPERAVRAFLALCRARRTSWRAPVRPKSGRPLPADLLGFLRASTGPMPYGMCQALLEAYGVSCCRARAVASSEEAVAAAEALGFPVVLKTGRPDLLHKSEAGGVALGLRDARALLEACSAMAERVGSSEFLVQEQRSPAIEILVGARRDETFGPVVAVGFGGFWTEAMRDVTLALGPLGIEEAEMLAQSGIRGRLLQGYRGLPAWEPGAVGRAMVAIGQILEDHPRVREIDVNPLFVEGRRAVAVDALVLVG